MSLFRSDKAINTIKVDKVDNGYCLSVYVEVKEGLVNPYTYDKKVKDLVFKTTDELITAIKEVWTV